MAARRIPKEVMKIFDKYIHNNVRQLHKDEAVTMLVTEFGLKDAEAATLFETFDKDHNGVMSLWEFQQFYMCAGANATAMVEEFKKLDKDGSGMLDLEEAKKGLAAMKTGTGRALEAKEIEFFLKTSAGEDNMVDLGEFINMLFRLKLYKCAPPPEDMKLK